MAVMLRIFDPPTAQTPIFVNQGMVTEAVSVQLVERFWIPGYFTITVPAEARHAQRLAVGRLVLIDGAFWGIVDDLNYEATADGDMLTASGRQLKGLTADRITLPPGAASVAGAQGYDAVTGSTEAIIKHFVSANMGPQAPAPRQVYGLNLAPDLGRGVAEDKYMSRHEALDGVLAALGEASGLGYDIVPDLGAHKLTFDVAAGADHTGGQSERKRVVFDIHRKTAMAQSYAYAASDARNLFYATMSGAEFANEALTVTYVREGEDEPEGIRRRERHLSLSVSTPAAGEEYNELRRLALIQAEDFRPAESFTVEIPPGGLCLYRQDYRVGDLVTARNAAWGVSMDARLTEMESQYTAQGLALTATFGKAPLNVFGRLKQQIRRGS